ATDGALARINTTPASLGRNEKVIVEEPVPSTSAPLLAQVLSLNSAPCAPSVLMNGEMAAGAPTSNERSGVRSSSVIATQLPTGALCGPRSANAYCGRPSAELHTSSKSMMPVHAAAA